MSKRNWSKVFEFVSLQNSFHAVSHENKLSTLVCINIRIRNVISGAKFVFSAQILFFYTDILHEISDFFHQVSEYMKTRKLHAV